MGLYPRSRLALFVFLAGFQSLLAVGSPVARAESGHLQAPTIEEVLAKMTEKDEQTTPALREYTSLRHYRLENRRLNKTAEMTVRVTFTYPGTKEFEIVSEEGSKSVRTRVFRRMIESERRATRDDMRAATQITPENYEFELAGTEMDGGRKFFILDATPKTPNEFLFRGKVWVDGEDYAITRIEGSPAKNPSFWVRRTNFVHRYQKIGRFWLPVVNHSVSEVLIFGRTDVTIEYSDYAINQEKAVASSQATR
jgi:outer membrane lipoprotein-sorting protein